MDKQTAPLTTGAATRILSVWIPVYDVVERLQVHVAAPAELTFLVACNLHLLRSGLIRAIFRARGFVLGGTADENRQEMGLIRPRLGAGARSLSNQGARSSSARLPSRGSQILCFAASRLLNFA